MAFTTSVGMPAAVCKPVSKPEIPVDDAAVYRFAHLIRLTESLLLKLFGDGLLSGTTHTCIGQEICQIAVVRALRIPDDHVFSNHRNHGHFLAWTGDVLGLVAEIMGREAGVCGGVGGSQHIAFGNFHASGVQAGMSAIGVGQALARQLAGKCGVTAIIVGDGTLGEGLLYESFNLAAVWHLPVLFVVEHNHIAQTTATRDTIGGGDIAARGAAFGLNTLSLQDDDPEFLNGAAALVEQVRNGGPALLVIDTERLGPHSKGDDLRDSAHMAWIRNRDPLTALGLRLEAAEREAIEAENIAFIAETHKRALDSPPATSLVAQDTILRSPVWHPLAAHSAVAGNIRMQLNSALRELLRDDARVVLLGEDLHDPYGGAFKITAGLSTEFPGRVISTPISEAGITGAGIGLAMSGYRPVIEIMFADFVTLCMDQIFNHAVKFPGMFPNTDVPLLIRTPAGGGRGYGPTHSQSPENLLSAVPGLTVLYPSHRHCVGQVLKSAVLQWPNPTVFFEHKLLYAQPASAGDYTVLDANPQDHGNGRFPTVVWRSHAPDVTLVAYGGILPSVEELREELVREELSVEIVAPCLLNPLPRNQLCSYLLDHKAVVVFEEGCSECGFGSALGSALIESGFRGRFGRVHALPVPIPAARSLEAKVIPDHSRMMESVLRVLGV